MKNLKYLALAGLLLFGSFGFQAQAQEGQTEERVVDYRFTGALTQEDLVESPATNKWFEPRYKAYKPDAEAMEIIEKNIHDYDIVMFLGTWCPDSHREVPKMFKILEETKYDMDRIEVFALARGMRSQEGVEKGYNIIKVPTIIFYKDGKEVNRYVERPRQSFEKDIAKILLGEEYKHFYIRD